MANPLIFIIEDSQDDYKKIKFNLLPSNCMSLLDSNQNDTNRKYDLSDEELKAIEIFSENQPTSLNKSEDFVKRIILENQNNLRMIICDLQINGNDEGGTELIKAIKTLTDSDDENWFAQQIPILILSHMTDDKIIKAVRESIGRCLYFTKQAAYDSAIVAKDVISYMISDFDSKYKKMKFEKKYKVALSFTGSTTDANGEEISQRDFIEEIANVLYKKYSEARVYYDYHKKTKTASRTPKESAKKIYSSSEYCVVFLSKKYVEKTSIWAKEEWEIIQKLVSEKRVLFVKLDNSIQNEDFEKKLGIDVHLYDNMVANFSLYNGFMQGKGEDFKLHLYKYIDKEPITKLGVYTIEEYKRILEENIEKSADFIIDTIEELDQERLKKVNSIW